MVALGTRAEARIIEREDYVGHDIVTFVGKIPVMAVEVMRNDGNDVAVFAPLVTPKAGV